MKPVADRPRIRDRVAADGAVMKTPEDSAFLLELRELRTRFTIGDDVANAVDGLSISVRAGEAVGIVGESGSGKSVTALSITRLLGGRHTLSGQVLFGGRDVLAMDEAELRAMRGGDISMIFQDPMTSLNPVMKISAQLIEGMKSHGRFSQREARQRALDLLKRMGISSPERVMAGHAHQLSGGMRQRVMLAIGFANKPQLIIADEPTTALDVTVQAQILDLLKEVSRESGTAVLLISHDLGVIANVCSRIVVMYGGEVVEEGASQDLLTNPQHPYTWALLNAAPHLDSASSADKHLPSIGGMPPDILNMPPGCRFADRCPFRIDICDTHPDLLPVGPARLSRCWVTQQGTVLTRPDKGAAVAVASAAAPVREQPRVVEAVEPLLQAIGLVKHFDVRSDDFFGRHAQVQGGRRRRLLDRARRARRLGRRIGLRKVDGGPAADAHPHADRRRDPLRGPRHRPLRRCGAAAGAKAHPDDLPGPVCVAEPAHDGGADPSRADPVPRHRRRPVPRPTVRSSALLDKVGLSPKSLRKFPHEFSGGQRQRIGIARALAVKPELIIADEPIAALDVNIQAQIINLLLDLQQEMGLTCLFIAHDLAVVRHISDRILVMYLGVIVESGRSFELFANPLHPYTKSLISAIPVHDLTHARPDRIRPLGEPASSMNPPSGCRFHTRCPHAQPVCRERVPEMREVLPGRHAACHFALELQ